MELSVNGLTESRRYLGEKKLPLHSWLSSAASGGYSEAASRCRPQVRERIAEARAAGGEGAEKCAQHPAPHLQPKKAALRLPFCVGTQRVACGVSA